MKKHLIALLISFTTLTSQADILSFDSGTKSIEGVTLNKSATTSNGTKLDLIGAGLRNKRVLIVNAKVYVIQIFSNNKNGFSRDAAALSSLVGNSSSVALKITMLRTVEASSLAVSFKEAIEANNYTIDSEVSKLLNVVESGADGLQGHSLLLLLEKTTDPTKVNFSYQDANNAVKKLTTESSSLTKVLSIWLGIPADKGLAETKSQLLQPIY